MSRYLDPFLEMLVAERGVAQNTRVAYQRDLLDYSAFLSQQGRAPEKATARDISDYLSHIAKSGAKAATAARRLSALRQFHRFLFAEGVRGDDPTLTIDGPKRGRPLPKIMGEGEVDRLLAAAHAVAGVEGVRLACLVELLYATGLRVSELVTLPLAAVRRDEPFILVRGKGGKERLVPLSDPARARLADYRDQRAAFLRAGRSSPYLFPSRSKEGHLTRQRFGQMLKQLALGGA